MGFPHKHKIIQGYARCRFCRIDSSIVDRGLLQIYDHWRSAAHRKKEQKYRLMTGLPLLNKLCKPMNDKDAEAVEQQLNNEPPVDLESPLGVSLSERIAMEDDSDEAVVAVALSNESGMRLWMATFLHHLVSKRSIQSLLHGLEMWANSLHEELTVYLPQLSHCASSGN